MLEVKNLTKIYKLKGGVETKALDNVSITFPSTGMVFLLGKSGSGKSTLLNLIGGLDVPTDGEIIVKGRSSKEFSGSDFDSYRNTFVGFIFQEYNILDEFTVEDNIALALELQGKSKDKERINSLLKDVDLANFAKRKPNTLSGGQKQRIAIARALVKDPEIIMADEPTGALDSNTGKQVLDTLKKLSEKKLIIVVSHDREFANQYGDRIIELKDGHIIDDVSRTKLEAKQVGNITFINDNTISIREGYKLDKEDLLTLNAFLAKTKGEVLITNQNEEIGKYKKQAKITNDGKQETFIETVETKDQRKYSKEESKFIRSKLPLRHAAKIGCSSLKLKPIRLMFTILLTTISLVLLGVVSTLMFYDEIDVETTSLYESQNSYASLNKMFNRTSSYGYTDSSQALLTTEEVEAITNKYDDSFYWYNYSYYKAEYGGVQNDGLRFGNLKDSMDNNSYYLKEIGGFAYLPTDNTLRQNIIFGEYPKASNEILITSYMFEVIKYYGILDADTGELNNINSYEDLIANKVALILNGSYHGQGDKFYVTGILDVSNYIPDEYKNPNSLDMNKQYYWQEEIKKSIFGIIFVTDDFYETNIDNFMNKQQMASYSRYPFVNYIEGYDGEKMPLTYISNISSKINIFDAYDLTGNRVENVIGLDECYIPVDMLYSLISNYNPEESNYSEYYEDLNLIREYVDSLQNYEVDIDTKVYNYKEYVAPFIDKYQILAETITFEQEELAREYNFKLSGICFNEGILLVNQSVVDENVEKWHQDDYETSYVHNEEAYISGVYVNLANSKEVTRELVENSFNVAADDSFYKINSTTSQNVANVSSMVNDFSKIFLWVGIVLIVFSMLLFFNFISVSITNKKKEIGILRAVGARGTDVFKIFFSESFVIALICFILAIVGSFFVVDLINTEIANSLGNIKLLIFGYISIAIIFGIAVITAILSTFLPVYNIAKRKPVESIKAI